ncbi:hypothetical protein V8D89_012119 [Ganoderma adspersum]
MCYAVNALCATFDLGLALLLKLSLAGRGCTSATIDSLGMVRDRPVGLPLVTVGCLSTENKGHINIKDVVGTFYKHLSALDRVDVLTEVYRCSTSAEVAHDPTARPASSSLSSRSRTKEAFFRPTAILRPELCCALSCSSRSSGCGGGDSDVAFRITTLEEARRSQTTTLDDRNLATPNSGFEILDYASDKGITGEVCHSSLEGEAFRRRPRWTAPCDYLERDQLEPMRNDPRRETHRNHPGVDPRGRTGSPELMPVDATPDILVATEAKPCLTERPMFSDFRIEKCGQCTVDLAAISEGLCSWYRKFTYGRMSSLVGLRKEIKSNSSNMNTGTIGIVASKLLAYLWLSSLPA